MTQRYIFYFKIVFITITFLYLIKRSLYIKKTRTPIFVFTTTLTFSIMKNIIKLFTFPLLTIIGFNSCASIPLKVGESENNSTYTVSYLFEHDGCKVYRFYDKGNYVYFTTRGDVTSITNDSTAQRTITINKTPYE